MSLARRFNARSRVVTGFRRVATIEFRGFQASLRDVKGFVYVFPALKGRAKFRSTRYPSKVLPGCRLPMPVSWKGHW
jgi:hypothetical protein